MEGFRLQTREAFQAICSTLGKPYCATDRCALYHTDALAALTTLARTVQPCVNLTITSPPYNIGKEYEQPLPLADYVDWTSQWFTLVHSVTSPSGSFWLNLGYVPVPLKGRAVPLPYLLWDLTPFYLMQEVVWHYGAGVASSRALSPRNEKFLWYVKDPTTYTFNLDNIRDPDVKYPSQKKNGKLKCNPKGKNPGDVWIIPKVTSGQGRMSKERTPHPAQFPEAIVQRLIEGWSNSDDLILDPFVGSGTTLACAMAKSLFNKAATCRIAVGAEGIQEL